LGANQWDIFPPGLTLVTGVNPWIVMMMGEVGGTDAMLALLSGLPAVAVPGLLQLAYASSNLP